MEEKQEGQVRHMEGIDSQGLASQARSLRLVKEEGISAGASWECYDNLLCRVGSNTGEGLLHPAL